MDSGQSVAEASPPNTGRFASALLGPRFSRRLSAVHAVDNFADALVNLSLVGSLFFSVSLSASQTRILLYLVLTAAPLALVAPFIGSALDRTNAGYRLTIVGSQVIKAIIAVALISTLLSVALYPLVFGLLFCRKTYAIAKTALLSQMTTDAATLVSASSQIARMGTIVGGLGTAVGGLLLATVGSTWLLAVAAVVYGLAAVMSSRLAPPPRRSLLSGVPRLGGIPDEVRAAVWSVASIRAAGGALTFLLALAIKHGGGDKWIFVAGLIMAGLGGFAGNLISTAIHRRMAPERVLLIAIAVPAAVCLVGVSTIGNFAILAIALSIGLGNSMASRVMEVIYGRAPVLARGRMIAFSELQLQIAGLVGAGLAVLLAPSTRPGFAIVALLLVVTGLIFAWRRKISFRSAASQFLFGESPTPTDLSLPSGLLRQAQRLASAGSYRMAIVVADSAVRVLIERGDHLSSAASEAAWIALGDSVRSVVTTDREPEENLVHDVLAAARALIERATPIQSPQNPAESPA